MPAKKIPSMNAIANFCFEAAHLKNIPRTGWHLLGISNADTVAAHANASSFIAFSLAVLEGADPQKCATMASFHELGEARIGDFHKMTQTYFPEKRAVENRVVQEQLSALPAELAAAFERALHGTQQEQDIVKDADYVECILQAKVFVSQGHVRAQKWIDNALTCLKSDSAKALAKEIVEGNGERWFESFKRIAR